jgi:nucleotide-binding universal stress UspA family protein
LPILVTKGPGKTRIRKILICTRAGEPGKSDIRFGGRLARHLGAQVTLLHVTQDISGASPQAQRHLRHASATLRVLDVANEVVVRPHPDPAEAILEAAAQHDLIVIGGHGPQSRSVFGRDDITVQVLNRTPCPVLVVPAEDG